MLKIWLLKDFSFQKMSKLEKHPLFFEYYQMIMNFETSSNKFHNFLTLLNLIFYLFLTTIHNLLLFLQKEKENITLQRNFS